MGLPGVTEASCAELLPLTGRAIGEDVAPEGSEAAAGEEGMTFLNSVSPGYFSTLGIRLVAGRDFADSDRPGGVPAAIVNEALARRFWPGRSPLGKRIRVGSSRELLEVVGVARDGKYVSLTEPPRPFVYLPLLQRGPTLGATVLLVRSTLGAAVLRMVREQVRGLDPKLPLYDVRTLAESLDGQLADRRQGTFVIGILGALAVLLAAVGFTESSHTPCRSGRARSAFGWRLAPARTSSGSSSARARGWRRGPRPGSPLRRAHAPAVQPDLRRGADRRRDVRRRVRLPHRGGALRELPARAPRREHQSDGGAEK